MNPLILLPLIAIFAYFMMIRPAKARQRQQQEMSSALAPGAEVRTIGGMLATVKAVDGDVVVLEPAPGIELRYIRQAVAAITSPLPVDDDETDDTDAEHTDAAETDVEQTPAVRDEVEAGTGTENEAKDDADGEQTEAKAEDEPAGETGEQEDAAKEAVAAGSSAKKA